MQRLMDSAAFKTKGSVEARTHSAIFYNPTLCGESASKPRVRLPPLRSNGQHLKRLLNIVLRSNNWEIAANDLFFLFDAGKPGTQ